MVGAEHLSTTQDFLLVSVPFILYMARIAWFKPSKIEVETLTRAFLPLALFLIKRLADWHKARPHYLENIVSAHAQLHNLKAKIASKGAVG